MKKVYAYTGKTLYGDKANGVVFATNLAKAKEELVNRGVKVRRVFYDPVATLSWKTNPHLSKIETANLFFILGKNIAAGAKINDALKSGKLFTQDNFLRNACEMIITQLKEGVSLARAMRNAGFEKSDYEMVEALDSAGKNYADSFLTRAESLKYETVGDKEVSTAIKVFLVFTSIVFIGFWLIVFVLGEGLSTRVAELVQPDQMVPLLAAYVGFINFMLLYKIKFTIIYVLVGGLLIWLLTGAKKEKVIGFFFPSYYKFKVSLDYYRTWQLWLLLHQLKDDYSIFKIASEIVNDAAIKKQNNGISVSISSGESLDVAVGKKVTSYRIKEQLQAVLSGKDINANMSNFLLLLSTEITILREKAVQQISVSTKILVGFALGLMMMVIILPSLLIATSVI